MSPDGRRLAFAAPAADAVGVCCSTIILVDLASGARRTWNFHDDGAAGDWLGQSTFTKLAWSPDSRRLAFTVSYEGDTVAVLDTTTAATLSDATEVIAGGGGDSRHPAWQATSGRLVVVNRAFECCFEDDYAGLPQTVAVDLAGGVAVAVLPLGPATPA